jgi:hypothetical protein
MSSYWPGPHRHPKRDLIICLVVLVGFGTLAFYLSADSQPAPVVTQP